MKKLLTILTVACFSLTLISTSFGADEKKMTKKDHIMMKEGKMMCQKDGQVTMMEKDMTLENGTMIKTDGTVIMKDGEKMMLKDGQAVDMMGKMMKDHMKKGEGEASGGSTAGGDKKP